MKLIEWYIGDPYDFGYEIFGLKTNLGIEGPPMIIKTVDRDYYQEMHIQLTILNRTLHVTVRLNKMPYRNKAEYIIWNRNRKNN